MKKMITFTLLASFLIFASSLKAQESDSVTDKIKERLQETAEVGIENIKDELVEKSRSPQKKAFIGTIKTIENNSLTLEYKDQTKLIELTDDTEYSKTSLKTLKPDDFVIAMGFVFPDQETLTTLKLSYVDTPQPAVARQLITGKIKEVDGDKVAVDGKILNITKKTGFNIQDIEEAQTEDLELEDNLFAIVTLDKNGDIDEIKNVLVLPGKNNPASLEPTNADATDSAETTPPADEE